MAISRERRCTPVPAHVQKIRKAGREINTILDNLLQNRAVCRYLDSEKGAKAVFAINRILEDELDLMQAGGQ